MTESIGQKLSAGWVVYGFAAALFVSGGSVYVAIDKAIAADERSNINKETLTQMKMDTIHTTRDISEIKKQVGENKEAIENLSDQISENADYQKLQLERLLDAVNQKNEG